MEEVVYVLCPLCGEEMVKGKLLGGTYKLKWIHDGQKLLLGTWATNAVVLTGNDLLWPGGRRYVEAFACEHCKKLMIDM